MCVRLASFRVTFYYFHFLFKRNKILECLIFPDFSLLNDLKQHLNFLLKLKVLIYYPIVKLQRDKLARRI